MKNIFKKIGYTTLVIALGLVSVYSVTSALAPTEDQNVLDTIKPLLHRGGGHQFVENALSLSQDVGGAFSVASNSGVPAVFDKPTEVADAFLAVLGDGLFGGRIFVGIPRSASGFTNTGDLNLGNWIETSQWLLSNPPLQKINVGPASGGRILSTDLIHGSSDPDNVCIDTLGSLVLCGNSPSTTYSCTGTAPANTVMCDGDSTGLTADTPRSLVSSCTSATKCELICGYGYTLSGGVCVEDVTYAWDVGDWGPCFSSTGICSGVPSGGGSVKVDWNGNAFDWEDGKLYVMNGGTPQAITTCATAPNLPYDMTVGENIDYNAAPGNTACFAPATPYTWPTLVYEPSTANGNWHQVNLTGGTVTTAPTNAGNSSSPGWINSVNNLSTTPLYGTGTGTVYRNRCDMNNNGTWTDDNMGGYCSIDDGEWENTGVSCSPLTHNGFLPVPLGVNEPNSTTVDGTTVICYGAPSGGGSCDGTNASSCTSVSGCSWTPGSSSQTRSVVCKDSNGTTVLDSLCPQPKPDTTQPCLLGGGLGVTGCYPIEYNELLGQYANAENFCDTRLTKDACMYSNSYWWQSPWSGSPYPVFAAPPVDGYLTFAAHSHGDTSATLVQPGDLDFDGLSLPRQMSSEGFNVSGCSLNDGEGCYTLLGPVCVWGDQ